MAYEVINENSAKIINGFNSHIIWNYRQNLIQSQLDSTRSLIREDSLSKKPVSFTHLEGLEAAIRLEKRYLEDYADYDRLVKNDDKIFETKQHFLYVLMSFMALSGILLTFGSLSPWVKHQFKSQAVIERQYEELIIKMRNKRLNGRKYLEPGIYSKANRNKDKKLGMTRDT